MNKDGIAELIKFVSMTRVDIPLKEVMKHDKTLNTLIESNKQMESDLQEVDRLCDEQYYEDDGANFYVDVELLKTITSKYKE